MCRRDVRRRLWLRSGVLPLPHFQRGSATLMTGVRVDDRALAGGLAACLAATEPVPLNPTCAAAHGSRFRRSGHDRCSDRVRCDGGLFEDTLSLRRLR